MSDNTFCVSKKIICILYCSDSDRIGITGRIVYDLLCLCSRLRHDLIGLRICLLHNLVLADQFCSLNLSLFQHRICFCLCVSQYRIPITDNLLITFDLIRSLHTKFPKQFIQMFFIYNNLRRRQRLKLTVSVNIFFDLINNLFNTAAHCYTLLLFIFCLSAAATAPGTNCEISPPKAATSFTVVELR